MKSLLLMLLFWVVQKPVDSDFDRKVEMVVQFTRSSLDTNPDRIKALKKDLTKLKRENIDARTKAAKVDIIKAEIERLEEETKLIKNGKIVWPTIRDMNIGSWGEFPTDDEVFVIQVIDQQTFLGRAALGIPEEAIFEGFSTKNVVDKSLVKIGAMEVVGTKTYTTVSGASRTIKHIKAVDRSEVDNIASKQWSEQLKTLNKK